MYFPCPTELYGPNKLNSRRTSALISCDSNHSSYYASDGVFHETYPLHCSFFVLILKRHCHHNQTHHPPFICARKNFRFNYQFATHMRDMAQQTYTYGSVILDQTTRSGTETHTCPYTHLYIS